MPTYGPNSGGTFANQAFGGNAWGSPSNAGASDNSYAATPSMGSGDISDRLLATNFGFSVPGGETVVGIVVEVERKASAASAIFEVDALLFKGGSSAGITDHASGTPWPTTEAYATYGTASDLWGTTWTPAQINASNFGFGLVVTASGATASASVDHIRITVYATGGSVSRRMLLGVG